MFDSSHPEVPSYCTSQIEIFYRPPYSTFSQTHDIYCNFVFPHLCSFLHYLNIKMLVVDEYLHSTDIYVSTAAA